MTNIIKEIRKIIKQEMKGSIGIWTATVTAYNGTTKIATVKLAGDSVNEVTFPNLTNQSLSANDLYIG